ncbi:MAG: L-threonylcarbamoyladenylate synthase [Solirubrobacteraceae bacterium]
MRAGAVQALERHVAQGEVVIVPTDTIYGLACDPESSAAVQRLHAIKGRDSTRAAAVMLATLEVAFAALPELGPRTRDALTRLLPGALTVLVANPRGRWPLAGGEALGLRVPRLEGALAPLGALERPLLQTSANVTGALPARRLGDIPDAIRRAVALALDAGELPGVASTVLDLRGFETSGRWRIARAGAVPESVVRAAVSARSAGSLDL